MREVQLYINNQRVDLFKDEKIEVNSTMQNISDISKTFTDYSATFTLPSSSNNNAIFDYFYNNDIEGSFKAQERAEARIEINHIPFRTGKIQLEGSEIKSNNPESYKVTFFGDAVSMKDILGDDTLSSLDYSSIATNYIGSTINNNIQSTADLDVRYPLISSERVWQYSIGGSDDISSSSNPIVYDELIPAIKDKKILDLISSKYGLTFTGKFFETDYFNKSFTWWKNSEKIQNTSEQELFIFNDSTSGSPLKNNVASVKHNDNYAQNSKHRLDVGVVALSSGNYLIDVYKNNQLMTTIEGNGTTSYNVAIVPNSRSLDDSYQFKFRGESSSSMVVYGSLQHTLTYYTVNTSGGYSITSTDVTHTTVSTAPLTLSTNFNFNTTAPEMKLSDWIKGIILQFNLTCFSTDDSNTFHFETINQWYEHGGEVDITNYIDTNSIKVDRPKLYKSISFEWQKSKSFMNTEFEGRLERSYGNLKERFDYDGKDFKVKLPFENMQFNKFTSTDLQVGYAIDRAVGGKSYVPKGAVKLFMSEVKSCSFYFNDGINVFEVTNYASFGQDQVYNLENQSMNFGIEQSSLLGESINNTLYSNFYQDYLKNLFNPKTRQLTVQCKLPLSDLSTLTLDDTIIIRDKRYLINNMKTDLTSGMVTFNLLTSFLTGEGLTYDSSVSFPSTGGSVKIIVKPIKPPKPTSKYNGGGGTLEIGPASDTWVATNPAITYTVTEESFFTFSLQPNNTGSQRIMGIRFIYKDSQGSSIRNENLLITQEG